MMEKFVESYKKAVEESLSILREIGKDEIATGKRFVLIASTVQGLLDMQEILLDRMMLLEKRLDVAEHWHFNKTLTIQKLNGNKAEFSSHHWLTPKSYYEVVDTYKSDYMTGKYKSFDHRVGIDGDSDRIIVELAEAE